MTVENTDYQNVYTADGSTSDFDFTFKITQADQVLVYVDDALQTEGPEYTLTTNLLTDGIGGTASFISDPAAASEVKITLLSDLLQENKLQNSRALPPATVMQMVDKLHIICQQQQRQLDAAALAAVDQLSPKRTYVYQPGDYAGTLVNTDDYDGWYIYYSSTGDTAIDFDSRYCVRLTAQPGGDDNRYYATKSQFRRSTRPFVRMQAGFDDVTSDVSFWLYLLNVSIDPVDITTASSTILNSVGFRYCADLGDTNIMAITADGTTQATAVDTDFTPTAGHLYDFDFDLRTSGHVKLLIDGTEVADFEDNLPVDTINLRWAARHINDVANLTDASVYFGNVVIQAR
jgi:hypothetical protein